MIDDVARVLLEACAARGVDFSRTLMLGRQQMPDSSYAERFFHGLGAESVDSLDASPFEGATIIADLNHPLPTDLRRRFTAVFDGGTLEHVFDVATALRSCLDMVALDGHYITVSPANNWAGHGFYQFSPELLFRVLSPDAGFTLRGSFVVELRRRRRWYAIRDPKEERKRLHWRNQFRTYAIAVARRTELVDLTDFVANQSDYAARWDGYLDPATDGGSRRAGGMKAAAETVAPPFVKRIYRAVRRTVTERLGGSRFRPVAVDRLPEHIG
jgi:hypothetical protein